MTVKRGHNPRGEAQGLTEMAVTGKKADPTETKNKITTTARQSRTVYSLPNLGNQGRSSVTTW